jgi:C_GCAxxG_C_C family probable redox protein
MTMSENAAKAEAMFREGYNCAQSVLACCGGPRGLEPDLALRLGAPLGGGMGCMGETCGAVTGAFLVIGLRRFKAEAKDVAFRRESDELVRRFTAAFKQRHKTISCRELLGFDISTPQGIEQARAAGVFKSLCPPLVRSAAEIVEDMLSNPEADRAHVRNKS